MQKGILSENLNKNTDHRYQKNKDGAGDKEKFINFAKEGTILHRRFYISVTEKKFNPFVVSTQNQQTTEKCL